MIGYTDDELLEMWKRGKSQEDLVKMLCKRNKDLPKDAARGRIEKILCRESFKNAGKPIPKEWQ